jgi:hypothetical protein
VFNIYHHIFWSLFNIYLFFGVQGVLGSLWTLFGVVERRLCLLFLSVCFLFVIFVVFFLLLFVSFAIAVFLLLWVLFFSTCEHGHADL